MYTRCLVCATPFEPNDELEYLPMGRRVAYDRERGRLDRKSTRLNSSHKPISYAVFSLKKKKIQISYTFYSYVYHTEHLQ